MMCIKMWETLVWPGTALCLTDKLTVLPGPRHIAGWKGAWYFKTNLNLTNMQEVLVDPWVIGTSVKIIFKQCCAHLM